MVATTNAIAKIAAVVAGLGLVAMSFASFAVPAKAATADELQAQINALLAQIAAMNGGSSASATFTMDLTLGSSGAEVTALQNWLIKGGYAIPAGATGYFGAQTQSALAAWQKANGVTPAAGYFGPVTRAKVNGMAGGSTGSTGGTSGLSGGEASLEDLQATDGEDDEVELGGSASVAEFEVDVEDADIELQRLDLTFDSTAVAVDDDDEPWNVFGEVTISIDGKEVASEDVSEEDDWLDNDGTNGEYVFRFGGLDSVVEEGETALIEVTVEADGGADLGTNDLAVWELYIDTDGLRGTDGEGIEQYIGDSTENVTFDVVEEGADDELDVNASAEDPDATVLQVEDDSRSDWYTVFAFELEADEDGGDIEIDTLPVDFTVSAGETVSDMLNDVKLVIDGEEFDDFDFTSAADTFGSTTFDIDGDFTVESGESVTVEVMVEFTGEQSAAYEAGDTVTASVVGANIEGDGADSVVGNGNVTGNTHTLQVSGINVTPVDDSAIISVVDGVDNDYATFEIEVEVEAFDEDIFIDDASNSFTFQFENAGTGAAFATTSATTSQSVSSNATIQSGFYRVDAGETETFTFTFTLDPQAAAEGVQYRAQLLTILFNDTAAAADATWTANPENDYQTNAVLIAD